MGNGIIPETIGVQKSSVDNFLVKFPKKPWLAIWMAQSPRREVGN